MRAVITITRFACGRETLRILTGLMLGTLLSGVGMMPATAAAAVPDEAIHQTNIGRAQLENKSSDEAIAAFEKVAKLMPESAAAWRNLARALMLPRKRDAEALDALNKALSIEPESAATHYLIGLIHSRESSFEEAVPHLEKAVKLDPDTAPLRYQLAGAYQTVEQHDKAHEQLKETIRLDPLHASAYFKLGVYDRKAGDKQAYAAHQKEFMRLRQIFGDASRSTEALEQCRYTLTEPIITPADTQAAAIDVTYKPATLPGLVDGKFKTLAVLSVDAQGRSQLIGLDDQGRVVLWNPNEDGTYVQVSTAVKLGVTGDVIEALVGNYHDTAPEGERFDAGRDALNDVLFFSSSGLALVRQTAAGVFADVTSPSGLPTEGALGACWFDVEHDGDLDLALALVAAGPLRILQNNGDGTFRESSGGIGLVLPESDRDTVVRDVVAIDLDQNVAVDVLAATDDKTLVFINQRAGTYAPRPDPPGALPGAHQVLADDLDGDGLPDVVLIRERELEAHFSRQGKAQTISIERTTPRIGKLIDYDNDGLLDVVLVGADKDEPSAGRITILRNTGAQLEDVTASVGLGDWRHASPLQGVLAFDADRDGDTDLLPRDQGGGVTLLSNEGGDRHKQLKIRLTAGKANPSGYGTHIEVRSGTFFASRNVQGPVIEIGIGEHEALDAVQTVWTNGVVDNQIGVSAGAVPLTIVEKNVAAGSCPYLYAWDGARMRFVTDLLGNSPLGLSIARGRVLPADPDEIVWIGGEESVRPRDGAYELVVTEELREVGYFDEVALLVVDHPGDVEVHPTDKLAPPPFVPTEVWALRKRQLPRVAAGDDGIDRTESLQRIDGDYAPAGRPLPPPIRGMCAPLTLTFDFGAIEPQAANVLALTGWIQYGDASTNIAMSQNTGLSVIPPTLEAESASKGWVSVDVVVGMPAGKTKTIVTDLTGKLPDDVQRLRLTTTFELYWDRAALFQKHEGNDVTVAQLPPTEATLHWHGYGDIRSRAVLHPMTPDFDRVSDTPPWRTTPQGWCTRYGDVSELVAARDERIVIMNGGDAITLRFDAQAIPPRPDGLQRSFFFFSVGWDKDADHNVVEGDQVLPLPVDMPLEDQLEYNTRFVPAVIQNNFRGLSG